MLVSGGIPCREPFPVGFAANYGFSSGDARGEAPCIRKLKVSPFPPGRALCERGSGGWGRQRQLTAGAAGDKEGKPPLRTPQRHGQPATSRASPPPGEWFALAPGAAWVQPRGCKGRSPLHKKTKSLPLPHRGRGRGDRGQNQKPKAGTAGDKEGKPPLRTPQRHGQPATSRASPPPGEWFVLAPGAAWVQPRGCKGRSPLHKITLGSPFPPGRGVGGWGRQRKLTAGSAGDQSGKLPASDTATAGRAGNEKTPPSPPKIPVSLLTGIPPSCIITMRKAGVWLGSRRLTQDLNNL